MACLIKGTGLAGAADLTTVCNANFAEVFGGRSHTPHRLYAHRVFCSHDGLALTVVSELLRLGNCIPDDSSVMASATNSAATRIFPQLTTVRVHGRQIGNGLVRLLDEKFAGRITHDTTDRTMIASNLIVWLSTGPANTGTSKRT